MSDIIPCPRCLKGSMILLKLADSDEHAKGFRGRCSLCDARTIRASSERNAEKFFAQGVFVRVKKAGG